MERFVPRAPFDFTPHQPPAAEDRTGPPLTQGFLFTLLSTVAAPYLGEATLAALAAVDPDAWYLGQDLETILTELEAQDPALPGVIGRTLYFMLRGEMEKHGILTGEQAIAVLPSLWVQATRGDSGVWRSELLGPGRARVEMAQPYNCRFEEGALRGFMEAYELEDVQIVHRPCMREGAPRCVLEVKWAI